MSGDTSPLANTLSVILIAFGIGLTAAYAFDLHGHTCARCGHGWHHLGSFNEGDQLAHTCSQCGAVQWWKDGITQEIKDAHVAHAAQTARTQLLTAGRGA